MKMRLSRKHGSEMRGYPMTAQRRLLLELIQQADGHIDARELYQLANDKGEFISPATIYRSLNLFKQLGLVDERRLGKVRCYYEIKRNSEHQHLVCTCCGKIMEIESPLIRRLVNKVQSEHGFHVTKVEFYLEGFCERCNNQETHRLV